MTRVEQLRDLETAKQVAALLEAENARLHQSLEALVALAGRVSHSVGTCALPRRTQ
jgi:transposase